MSDEKLASKAQKKAAKAQQKVIKKQGATNEASPARPATGSGLTPAERSANAAERQVKLQWLRVALAAAGVLVGLATVWMALSKGSEPPIQNPVPTASQPIPKTSE